MKVLGLIAEYNPFHNGHLLHLNKSKELTKSDFIVVVMSGNYVQRGEPAIVDKYSRTKMALLSGADIVLELPVYYATSSAEFFSYGAISILNHCGIVNTICFGSESGNIDELHSAAKILSNEDTIYKKHLKFELAKGISYPAARSNALRHISSDYTSLLCEPNNILAIEYLKALDKLNSEIIPYTITRESAHYHSSQIKGTISSATAIRKSCQNENIAEIKNTMPQPCFEIFNRQVSSGLASHGLNTLSHVFQYILKQKDEDWLNHILDVTEGLENRMIKFSKKYYYLKDIITQIKTKRYTFTKIQRAILHILLEITKSDFENYHAKGGPQYLRVLGFRKESSFLFKEIENKASLPLLMNIKNAKNILSPYGMSMLQKEIQTTDIYSLTRDPNHIDFIKNQSSKYMEYKIPLVII